MIKKHKKGQGSISRDEFNKIIKFIGKKYIRSNVFIEKLNKNSLKKMKFVLHSMMQSNVRSI